MPDHDNPSVYAAEPACPRKPVRMRYPHRGQLLAFVILLGATVLAFVGFDLLRLGAPGVRSAGVLLIAAMIWDMVILNGAWRNTGYVAHHAATAGFALVAIARPDALLVPGSGCFAGYMLLGAISKRIRILRNWDGPHEDRLERLLKRAYLLLGKADYVVVPAYVLFYVAVGSAFAIPWLVVALGASCLALLGIRILLA